MPAKIAAELLERCGAELAVPVKVDAGLRGQGGLHSAEQGSLIVSASATKRQERPSERQQAFVMDSAQRQDAPAILQVGTVHDEIDLAIGPVPKQIPHEGLVTLAGTQLFVFQSAPQVLNEIFSPPWQRQTQGEGSEMAIGTESESLTQPRQVGALVRRGFQTDGRKLLRQLAM
jgi:hypothetical protein